MKPIALLLALLAGSVRALPGQAAVVRLARDHPDQTRDSIATALRTALGGGDETSAARATALALASAYALAWKDSFLLERSRWVTGLTGRDAARFLAADSLRKQGNAQLFGEGPARARATWRASGQLFTAVGDSVGETLILGNIGAAFYEEGLLDSAEHYLLRTLERSERLGDQRTAGNAATILGNVAWEQGDLRRAMQLNLRAAALHRAAGNFTGLAADHNNAGLLAEELRDLETAEREYRTALAITEAHGTPARAADLLVNLGALASERGALDTARTLFDQALARYHNAGEGLNEALVRRNLAGLEASVGTYDAAIKEYQAAIALFDGAGHQREAVDTRRLLASLYGGVGRPDEALEQLAAAERLLAMLRPPDQGLAAAVATVRGDVEVTLNRFDDARASFATAERLARPAGDHDALVAIGLGRAQLALRRGQHADVIRALEPVAAVQPPGRDRAWTYLLLGVARGGQDDVAGTTTALDAAVTEFTTAGDRPGAALALGARAEFEASHGRPQRALRLFAEAHAQAVGWPSVAWWLHLGAGRALEAAGDERGALVQYDSAVAVVESLADWIRFDDRRALFLEDKWEPYAAAAALRARRGDLRGALQDSERLRARHLLDLLARRRSSSSLEGALRARERHLRTEISNLTAALFDVEDGRRGPSTTERAEVREALLAAQTSYRHLMDRLRIEEPQYVQDLRGQTVAVEQIQRALRPDQLLLEYLVADDRVWIFAVTDTAVHHASVAVGRATIRAQIDFARWALQNEPGRTELWGSALRGLYDVLIRPVHDIGLLAGHRRLIVAPHLELHYLPFEALIDSTAGARRYLVETHDVAYVPSASVWLRLRDRGPDRGRGILALAPETRALAGTRAEMDAIAATWGPDATIRRGATADERALRTASGYRIVHLATRGVLNQHNPLFSYVELAPTADSDGRLEVYDVFRLRLAADLLVLSACQTALGSGSAADVPNGDDWVGLLRTFLYAGVNNVLATLWAVDDRRTADMARLIHQQLAAGKPYAEAIGNAKREALQSPALSHPYYWAGFVLTGAQ